MKKKSFWSLLLLLTIAFVLAACSTSSDGGDSKDDGDDGDDNTSSTPQDLVFGRGGDSVSLDPGIVTDGESFKVTQNLFETLLNFGEQDTTIKPGLAKDWKVSDDGLTYTFNLEEGVKFHDGTDFNAEAVIENVNRWKAGNKEQFYYFNSMFKAEGEDIITKVIAEDEHTDIFKLSRAQAPFLKNLAMILLK